MSLLYFFGYASKNPQARNAVFSVIQIMFQRIPVYTPKMLSQHYNFICSLLDICHSFRFALLTAVGVSIYNDDVPAKVQLRRKTHILVATHSVSNKNSALTPFMLKSSLRLAHVS